MKVIDEALLDHVTEQAKRSARLRMNYNFHSSPEDPVQQMLNAIEPGSYLRPHRHPDAEELFFLVRGKGWVLIFDDAGNLSTKKLLDPMAGEYGVVIPAGIWHSMISLESGTTIFEVKPGPYRPLDEENFAPWAPKPDETEEVARYLEGQCFRCQ